MVFSREALARLEALKRELAALKAIGRGTPRIAASIIPGERVLSARLAEFREVHPSIKVRRARHR
jgi:DNA-binding transcriptional LysR family regulator